MQELRNRVAVVTGGASGIGKALVRAFLDEGMKVVIADVEEPALKQAAQELGGRGEVATAVTDVADRVVLERLEVTDNGQVAYTEIRRSDYETTGATPQDTEDLVNFTRSLNGVEVGLSDRVLESAVEDVDALHDSCSRSCCSPSTLASGSGTRTSPPGEFAVAMRASTHCRLIDGCRPPAYLKMSEQRGCSQIVLRPSPIAGSSRQLK